MLARPSTYHGDHTAGADAVVDANHALVVGVLAPAQEVLVTQVVGALIHNKAAALHPDRVAAVEVGVEVGAVAHALVVPALEVSVLVEYDLQFVDKSVKISITTAMQKYIYVKKSFIPTLITSTLTFPIVIFVGGRLMVNRCSLGRSPFILSSRVMAQHKVLSSK